jgi:SOS response regulatory protein OraA/RecX
MPRDIDYKRAQDVFWQEQEAEERRIFQRQRKDTLDRAVREGVQVARVLERVRRQLRRISNDEQRIEEVIDWLREQNINALRPPAGR